MASATRVIQRGQLRWIRDFGPVVAEMVSHSVIHGTLILTFVLMIERYLGCDDFLAPEDQCLPLCLPSKMICSEEGREGAERREGRGCGAAVAEVAGGRSRQSREDGGSGAAGAEEACA